MDVCVGVYAHICVCFSSSCDSRVNKTQPFRAKRKKKKKKKITIRTKVDVRLSCRDSTNGFEFEMSCRGVKVKFRCSDEGEG